MLSSIGPMEIFLVLLLILLLFGAKRIPEMAQGMGKGIKEFKKAMKDVQEEVSVSETSSRNTISPPANQVPRQAVQAEAEKKEQSKTPAA